MSIKSAVVVGASKGVGRAVAVELAKSGISVASIARDRALLDSLLSEIHESSPTSFVLQSDVRVSREVDEAAAKVLERFGDVDALVYCAGNGIFGSVLEFSDDSWRDTLDTNLSGLFFWVRALAARFSSKSHLIAISSGASKQGIPELSAYCASKFALNGFMESMAAELPDTVRVATIVPGSILTDWGSPRSEKEQQLERGEAKFLNPEDVADAVKFLLEQPESARTQELNLWPA